MNPVNRLSRILAARSLPHSRWKESQRLAFTPTQSSQRGLTSHTQMYSIGNNASAIIATHWEGQGITKGLYARYLPFHPMFGVA